jgi:hypothetical protein
MQNGKQSEHAVLRLWAYADAPPEFQRALPNVRHDYWIVHVPSDLMQQDVLAVLQLNSISQTMTQVVRLSDGGALLAGPFLGQAPGRAPKEEMKKIGRSRAAGLG